MPLPKACSATEISYTAGFCYWSYRHCVKMVTLGSGICCHPHYVSCESGTIGNLGAIERPVLQWHGGEIKWWKVQLQGDILGFAIGNCETSIASPHSFGVEGIPSFSQIHNSRNPHRLSEFLYRAGILFWSLLAHLAYMGPRWRQKDFHISHCFFGFKASEPLNHALDVDGSAGCAEWAWARTRKVRHCPIRMRTREFCIASVLCLWLFASWNNHNSFFSMIGFERTIGSAATKPEIKASYSCDISLRSQKVHRKFSSTVIKRAEPNMVHKKHLLHGRNHWNHWLFPE